MFFAKKIQKEAKVQRTKLEAFYSTRFQDIKTNP